MVCAKTNRLESTPYYIKTGHVPIRYWKGINIIFIINLK